MTATATPMPAPALPTAIGVAGPASMVQIKNVGVTDFVKEYHVDKIRIPAGQSMIVMWDIMVYWLGNPALTDASIRERDRTREVNRLRVLYGAYDDDAVWEVNKPKLEVYQLTGERVWTVVDDPDGEHVTPASQSMAYAQTYEAQIALMQKQIDALQAMMQQQAAVTPALAATPVAPTSDVTGPLVANPAAPGGVPMPPAPMPTPAPFNPTPPVPAPAPAPPFNHPQDMGAGNQVWTDTTPAPPPNLPPFIVDGPPEDGAAETRVS